MIMRPQLAVPCAAMIIFVCSVTVATPAFAPTWPVPAYVKVVFFPPEMQHRPFAQDTMNQLNKALICARLAQAIAAKQ